MVVADLDGVVRDEIAVEGLALSSGAFVENSLLVNELFEDHYRIRSVDLVSKRVTSMRVEHSPEYLRAIEPIILAVDESPAMR